MSEKSNFGQDLGFGFLSSSATVPCLNRELYFQSHYASPLKGRSKTIWSNFWTFFNPLPPSPSIWTILLNIFDLLSNVDYTANFFIVNFIDFDYVINPTIVPSWFWQILIINLTVSKSLKVINKYHDNCKIYLLKIHYFFNRYGKILP